MAINIKSILLRILTDPNYAAKGSSLTWTELDTDLKILADNIAQLQLPSDGGFSPYDNSKTYSNVLPDYVSYDGNIYEYIKAYPQSGVTPGSDPLTWQAVSLGQFAHQQNTDQYIDLGGPYQSSAQEIYNAVHTTAGEQIFKGEWVGAGSPTPSYSIGDVVLHDISLYEAIADNTNSEPGVGSDWLLQGVDEGAYSINWAGSLLPPTQQSIWNWSLTLPTILEADFDSVYYRLDGLYHLEGDMNAYNNNIDNLGSIGVGVLAGQSYAGQQALINALGNGAEVPFIHGLFQNENSSGRSQFIVSSENYPDISFVTMTHGSTFGHNYYAPNKPEMSDAGFGILAMQGSESQGLLLGTASNKPVYIMANNTMYWLFGPTGNTGLASGVDFSDGVTVTCFGEATTEPTTPATQGALLWAKGAILKTNTDMQVLSVIVPDNDISGHFVKITAGSLTGILVTPV